MKRIIDGKTYNTATAALICNTSNDYHGGDFDHESSNLYVTKKGAFFLAGSGGPRSRFASCCGDETQSGSDIIPLTKIEALNEAETSLLMDDTDIIEKVFGDILEDA
jgi:hypothetical protein